MAKKQAKKSVETNKTPTWSWLLLVVLPLLVFSPLFNADFINLDDPQYLIQNKVVQAFTFDNIKLLFSSAYVGNYQPVSMLSYMMEYTVAGSDPFIYHLSNILLHVLNILLVYKLVKLLSRNHLVALVTALLFGMHPMHVESVAWVSARKDLLYTLFFILSSITYLQFLKSRNKRKLVFSLGFFILSILSKAQAVILPVVLLLYDYLLSRKIERSLILEKIPFFLLSIVFGLLAFTIQKQSGAVQDFAYFPFFTRLLFSCYGLLGYFIKLIAPFNLSVFYPYPETKDVINDNLVYFAPFILLIATLLIYRYARKNKVILFGVGFFIVTIALVLQLIPVGDAVMADRYSYLPFIGLFFSVGSLAQPYMLKHKAANILCIGVLVALSFLSYERCTAWQDSISLYSSSLDKYPAAIIHNNRGAAYAHMDKHEEALSDFNKVLELKPAYPNGHMNRGITLQKLERFNEAIADFMVELKQNPRDIGALNNIANCYKSLNDLKSATEYYNNILKIDPENLDALYSRGEAYGRSGQVKASIADFSKVIIQKPNYAEAYSNRGIAYSLAGQTALAINDFNKAIELNPENLNSYMNRAVTLKAIGRYEDALKDALYAKRKGHPVDEGFLNNLAQNSVIN